MHRRHLLLVVLLVLLASLKAAYDPGLGPESPDAAFYYQVARHVAEGDGFVTSVSLYHKGYRELPHPTVIYPVWPLTLGLAARVVSLPTAATVFPEMIYLVALFLLYLLANRLYRRVSGDDDPTLWERPPLAVDAGHLAVLILGLNPVFFHYTSLPYTEGLAFLFAFAALLALDRFVDLEIRASAGAWAALAGGVAALAYLTRYQMVMLPISVIAALLLVGWRTRNRRALAAASLAAGVVAVTVLPWVLHVWSFAGTFDPMHFLQFSTYRELPEVERFQSLVPVDSWRQWIGNVAAGLMASLDPLSEGSYVALFGLQVFVLPLVLLHLVAEEDSLLRQARSLFRPARVLVVAMVLAGGLQVLPLHFMRSRYGMEWRFHHRHALPLLLVLLPALLFLLARGKKYLRIISVVLVAASLVGGGLQIWLMVTQDQRHSPGMSPNETALVEWLDAHRKRPTVLTTRAQHLSAHSRAGFHWMECREDAEKVWQLVEHAGVDYVLLYGGEERCRFAAGLDRRPDHVFTRGAEVIRVFDVRGDVPSETW